MSLLSACVHCFAPESAVIPLGLRVVETTGLLGVRPLSFHRARVCPIMELKLRRKHCYVGKRGGTLALSSEPPDQALPEPEEAQDLSPRQAGMECLVQHKEI